MQAEKQKGKFFRNKILKKCIKKNVFLGRTFIFFDEIEFLKQIRYTQTEMKTLSSKELRSTQITLESFIPCRDP
jgi:hypothetical protein